MPAPGAHTGLVREVRVAPSGTHVLSGSIQGELILHDLRTGEPVHAWRTASRKMIEGIAFARGGYFYACSVDGNLYRGRVGESLSSRASGHKAAYDLDLRGDGRRLVVGGNDGLRFWRGTEGPHEEPPPLLHRGPVRVARFHPKGGGLALGAAGAWRWALGETGALVSTIPGGRYFDLDWSPDGERVAAITMDGALRVYTWPALELLVERTIVEPDAKLKFNYYCRAVCYSADGAELYTAGAYDDARVWNAATLEPQGSWSFGWPDRWTEQVERGPDGVLLACGNSSRVQAYDAVSKRPLWGPVLTSFCWAEDEHWVPADRVLDWLGDDLVLNTNRGTWVLDPERGVAKQLVPGLAGAQLLVNQQRVYWRNKGRLVWADAARDEEGLRLGPVTEFKTQRYLLDVASRGREVYALSVPGPGLLGVLCLTPDAAPKERVWQVDLGSRPRFAELTRTGNDLWVYGDTQLVALERDSERVLGRPVSSRPRIVTQLGPGELVANDETGTLTYMNSGRRRDVDLAQGLHAQDIRLLDEGRVAVGVGPVVQVLHPQTGAREQRLDLPPGRLLAALCASPEKDAIYVWTTRGSVYRYRLYR